MASSTPRIDAHERNLIINGNMDFWQRGTTFSVGFGYTADRYLIGNTGYTTTITRSTDVPTFAQSGYQSQYSLLITNGTGASPTSGQYQQFQYKMEGLDYQALHSRKARIQFWVKQSVTGTYSLSLLNASGTRSYNMSYTINSANTWEKKFFDLTFDTTGTWNFDNSLGVFVLFNLTSGSGLVVSNTPNTWLSNGTQGFTGQTQFGVTTGATFQLAQFMVIPGDFTNTPTAIDIPFRRCGNSIAHEFQMACRYYFNLNAASGSFAVGPGAYINAPYPTPLRASPNSFFVSNTVAAPAPVTVNSNVVGAFAGQFVAQAQNSSGSTLGFTYTVDAEL